MTVQTINPPLLSLVIPGRNDAFMGNFKWRFETALNYLANSLEKIGRSSQAEVIICDWGSQEPLYTTLSLSKAAQKLVRFILVPPALAQELQKDSEFPVVLTYNIAARRSRGQYIAQTDSDIVFTPQALQILFDTLEGKVSLPTPVESTFIFSWRRLVPWKFVRSSPSLAELDWLVRRWGKILPLYPDFNLKFCNTAFVLLHRNLWEESSGFDQRLIYWGWMEIDLGLRMSRRYPVFNMHYRGLDMFHLEHYAEQLARRPVRKCNDHNRDNEFCPNGPGWGFPEYSLSEYAYPDSDKGPFVDPFVQKVVFPAFAIPLFFEVLQEYARQYLIRCIGFFQHYSIRAYQITRDTFLKKH